MLLQTYCTCVRDAVESGVEVCGLFAFSLLTAMHAATAQPMPHGQPQASLRGLLAVDRLIRQPLVPLIAATLCGLVIFVAATQRALPVVGGLLATIVIGTTAPWLAVTGLRGRCQFDRSRCRVGDTLRAEVGLTGPAARWVDAATIAWPGGRVISGANQGSHLQLELTPVSRGWFPSRRPSVCSSKPFGLITARRTLAMDATVIVRPLTEPIRFPAAIVAPRRHGHQPSEGVLGGCGDVLGSRDYRPGDTIRQIHWAQTARRDSLVVCERPGNGCPTIRLRRVLSEASLQTEDAAAVLETFVLLASSIIEHWAARGMQFELLLPEASGRVQDRPSLEAALDTLACLGLPAPAEDGGVRRARHPVARQRIACDLDLVIGPADAVRQQLAATTHAAPHAPASVLAIALETGPQLSHHARVERLSGRVRLILLPATADAPRLLDACFSEIGHDPDTTRQ
jgi:uncharacterized protein (DUF58 family)